MRSSFRLALFALVVVAGLAAGCKSSGCSSCSAAAPAVEPARAA